MILQNPVFMTNLIKVVRQNSIIQKKGENHVFKKEIGDIFINTWFNINFQHFHGFRHNEHIWRSVFDKGRIR